MATDPMSGPGAVVPYEQRLQADRRWAMDEGDAYFARRNSTFLALRRFARCLDEREVPYAVAGALALFAHGYRRFTHDIDLLIRPPDLVIFHDRLGELDCVQPDVTRRSILDRTTGVRIDFLATGKFPGNGRPQPYRFPDPTEVGVRIDGISFVTLPTVINLKLAAGITGGIHCLRHWSDVIEAIKVLDLPLDFADELDLYVAAKYREFWQGIQDSPIPDWLA